jgi:hypothetical protein
LTPTPHAPAVLTARRHRAIAAGMSFLAGTIVSLQLLGRIAGSTRFERRRRLPGDELVPTPSFVTNHGITIDAPAERIWPWLVQMGWHRGGWYTAPWVDRLLFPANKPSADRLVADWQSLRRGDFVPDGPPETGCGFIVEQVEPQRHLVLHSTTHLPPGWSSRFGASIDWTWTFVLDEVERGRTRFLFRSRARLRPRWLAVGYGLLIVPADFVMARQMMGGVKSRAQRIPRVSARKLVTRASHSAG